MTCFTAHLLGQAVNRQLLVHGNNLNANHHFSRTTNRGRPKPSKLDAIDDLGDQGHGLVGMIPEGHIFVVRIGDGRVESALGIGRLRGIAGNGRGLG